jgi:hypothetical protein
VFGLQVTLLDLRSDAVSVTTVAQCVSTIPALGFLTDDPSFALRSPVTDEFSGNANECYLIQNQTAFTAAKLYILQSHMTLFNILVLMIYRLNIGNITSH